MSNATMLSNGRVDVSRTTPPDVSKLFAMYDKIPAVQCSTFRDATEGIWNETRLSRAFFSDANITILQNGIRAGVYRRSNNQYIVGNQACDPLKIIMRSTFLQHSTNQPHNIPGQIAALNDMVLNYCIKHVYNEAQGHMKYLTDVNTLAVPIALPVMSSQNDKRNYRMPNWF